MYPDFLIHINGKGYVTLYGICIGVGVLLAFLLFWWMAKKGKVDPKYVDFTSINLLISTTFGFFCAAFFPAMGELVKTGKFTFGTLSFVAGAVGGAILFFVIGIVFRKKHKGSLLDVISIAACCLVLAHGIGRMGCFFSGCCHGHVTDSVWGVVFKNYGPDPRIPTQLFEVVFDLVLCFFMVVLYLKEKFEYNMSLWMIGYGSFRFLIEHLRDEPTRMYIADGFSMTMLVCIFLVAGGIAYYFIMSPFIKRRKAYLLAYPNGEPTKSPTVSDDVTDTPEEEVKADSVPNIEEK